MTREMRKEDRTLENALDDDFIPENVDKWVDELVSEINWDEDSTTDDEDVTRNFDDVSSNESNIGRNYINMMTKKFIKGGGKITYIPTIHSSGLNSVGYLYKTTNTKDKPFEWSEESEYAKFHRIPQRLCPYNIYRKYVEGSKEEPQTENDDIRLLDKESLSELLRIEDILEERKLSETLPFNSYIPLNA